MKKTIVGGVYINVSENFQRGPLPGLSRTLKANQHDAGVIERIAVASRGRNPENPSDRTAGSPTEQRLEPNMDGVTNTLTTVQKDNMVLEKEKYMSKEIDGGIYVSTDIENLIENVEKYNTSDTGYRIRKLTPKECFRLMSFTDEDFHKAESVVSNSQLYKQAGNSIVKNVLIAIFGQMIPGKEDVYKNYNPYETRIKK